jgi:hypothetical protein
MEDHLEIVFIIAIANKILIVYIKKHKELLIDKVLKAITILLLYKEMIERLETLEALLFLIINHQALIKKQTKKKLIKYLLIL